MSKFMDIPKNRKDEKCDHQINNVRYGIPRKANITYDRPNYSGRNFLHPTSSSPVIRARAGDNAVSIRNKTRPTIESDPRNEASYNSRETSYGYASPPKRSSDMKSHRDSSVGPRNESYARKSNNSDDTFTTAVTFAPRQSGDTQSSRDSVKDEDIASGRSTAGAQIQAQLTEHDLFQVVDEINEQTCILKAQIVDIIGRMRENECHCSDFRDSACFCVDRNGECDCRLRESEQSRTRGGSYYDPSHRSNYQSFSSYHPNGTDDQRVASISIQHPYQFAPPVVSCNCPHQDCNPNRRSTMPPRYTSNAPSALIDMLNPSAPPPARHFGGYANDYSNQIAPADPYASPPPPGSTFFETVSKIQQDIEMLRKDLGRLTICNCDGMKQDQQRICVISSQLKDKVDEIKKALSFISDGKKDNANYAE